MVDDKNCEDAGGHKSDGGHDGTHRESADAAYSVAARATIAEAGTESHEQARQNQSSGRALQPKGEYLWGKELEEKAAREQTGNEDDPPQCVVCNGLNNAAEDAADAGDLAVAEQKH